MGTYKNKVKKKKTQLHLKKKRVISSTAWSNYHIPPEDYDYIQGVAKSHIDFTEEVLRHTVVYVLNDRKERTCSELLELMDDLRNKETLGGLIRILLARYEWSEGDRLLFGAESTRKLKITNEREQLTVQNLISKRNSFSHRWHSHIENKNIFDSYCKMQTMIMLCRNRIHRLIDIIKTDAKQESKEILRRIEQFFEYYRSNDRLHYKKHKYVLLCIFAQSRAIGSLIK